MSYKIKLRNYFSLEFNPFSSDIPWKKLYCSLRSKAFINSIKILTNTGGFALLTGEPGLGKSQTLRLIKGSLEELADMKVSVLSRPQSNIPDLYNELGDIFSVKIPLSFNRWNGFKKLRDRWKDHIQSTLLQPVIIIDEAESMQEKTLNELRLLSSLELDSKNALTIILAGDNRLISNLRTEGLLPLESRIKTRLNLEKQSVEDLDLFLTHLLIESKNPNLFTQKTKQLLIESSNGNYRSMIILGNKLLNFAFSKEKQIIDEKLFFEFSSSYSI